MYKPFLTFLLFYRDTWEKAMKLHRTTLNWGYVDYFPSHLTHFSLQLAYLQLDYFPSYLTYFSLQLASEQTLEGRGVWRSFSLHHSRPAPPPYPPRACSQASLQLYCENCKKQNEHFVQLMNTFNSSNDLIMPKIYLRWERVTCFVSEHIINTEHSQL